jgi:hypothetical protein
VRLSSATETTQPLLSNELCMELGDKGFDETGAFADATAITAGLDRCQHKLFVLRSLTKSGLLRLIF